MAMELQPITLRAANAFILVHHRHRPPARGCNFALALNDAGQIHAVAVVGRPSSRHLDNGTTAELTRLCTDGTPNAASQILSAARRAAQALGYKRLLTYTLDTEPGTSLRAAGWQATAKTPARSWNRTTRPRNPSPSDTQAKIRWEPPPPRRK